MVEEIVIGGTAVPAGRRVDLELPFARLFTGTRLSLPVAVLHGARPGPRLWLDATVHGDELNGMEIIRRVLGRLDARRLSGLIIAVPVVNVFGFIHQTRYLPDRRDLNRSFPGSPQGALASRLAHLFMQEVVEHCDYGLDFHTGSLHRENLPQIRAHLDDPETRRLAEAFGAPLMYQSAPIRGSLRAASRRLGKPLLVYEGGEPRRFNEDAINTGVQGTLRVLAALGMWPDGDPPPAPPYHAGGTRWLRAGRSGIFHLDAELGGEVVKGQTLGRISADCFATKVVKVRAPFAGLVMGYTNNPLVNQGDALIHLAQALDAEE